MSNHIGAKQGEIAQTVLLPGDPLRARYIAETLLEKSFCFNQVRGMLGYTGFYKEKRISVMGTGMGIPTLSIYVNELISDYGASTLIRVGTCGALQPGIELGDIVLPMSSSTNSALNQQRFQGMDYAPTASFRLLLKAYQVAIELGAKVHVGGIYSSDTFYNDDPDWWKIWADYGALVCEMETAGLYTIAARLKVEALSVLTVSDSLLYEQAATSEQREKGFTQMAEIALEIAPA